MAITKNTMMSMSIATMITFVGAIWMASGFIQAEMALIDDAVAAGSINKIELTQHALEHARTYRLQLRSHLRKNPDDVEAQKDLDEVNDDIEDLKKVLECLRENRKTCG